MYTKKVCKFLMMLVLQLLNDKKIRIKGAEKKLVPLRFQLRTTGVRVRSNSYGHGTT